MNKHYCSKCNTETNQGIIFEDTNLSVRSILVRNEVGDSSREIYGIQATIWKLTKCNGCDQINLKVITRTNPDDPNSDRIITFPKKSPRSMPSWILELPIQYIKIINEVYIALDNDAFSLALMGARTLLDIFLVEKVGDVGGFGGKLERAVSNELLTKQQCKVINAAIETGSAAAHRGFSPEKMDVFRVLDITESLLNSYIIDRHASRLEEITPKRNK